MTKVINISDEAYTLLHEHMRDAGVHRETEKEMDELFTIADQVWNIATPKAAAALAAIRGRVTFS